MRKRPTLVDVAREAGVSKTTASMALNGKGHSNIPDATRERVVAAAVALEFRPHAVARALTRRCAEVLGIVCTVNPFEDLSHHAFEHCLYAAIFYHSLERGYNPMIYGFPARPDDRHDIHRFADGRSDAFILIYPRPESPLLRFLHEEGIPTVTVSCRDNDPRGRWVDSDNEAGIRSAVKHLVELGHRRIAYLSGPPAEDNARTRLAAFRNVLAEYGLPVREDWMTPYTWKREVTRRQLDRFLADPEPPTALLAWYDFAAEDVYEAAARRGLRIPQDISVIGFDDAPSSRIASPPLTTVRQDPVLMGEAAVDLALAALDERSHADSPRSVICPIELIVRGSTAPPGSPRTR